MSGPVDVEAFRSPRLISSLFWAGVGLAAVAVLLLLMGNGIPRVAGVAALLSFILLGLGNVLRPDLVRTHREFAGNFYAELDALRNELRVAGRTSTEPLYGRLREMHAQLEVLRGQLDAMRLGAAGPVESTGTVGARIPSEEPAGQRGFGVVRAGDGERSAAQPGNGSAPHGWATGRERRHVDPADGGPGWMAQPATDGHVAVPRPRHGIVRRTETVHVTTRQTVVDQHGEDTGGHHYGLGPDGRAAVGNYPAAVGNHPAAGRYRYGDDVQYGAHRGRSSADYSGQADDPDHRMGGWAAEGVGTELRMRDRWVSVRQDPPGPGDYWAPAAGQRPALGPAEERYWSAVDRPSRIADQGPGRERELGVEWRGGRYAPTENNRDHHRRGRR